ncbi:PspC domain-containing protein [Bombilactobacillus bombi]|uniref:PspC domain-containing protein n=1 Tax=Bombilactobacillus bombi TaxID=1303590 RepID=UPI0015E5E6E3|nr:PspC domain-containing protein [Bombilactobacillus bombi]MBA1435143.1 PspC domain-containing protein [Bombilactobacillus bombi]
MHIPIKRSGSNYVLAGVLGGLADYLDWNVNVLRVLWVLLTPTVIFPGVVLYLLLWLIMEKPDEYLR